ncbi:MAG: hypothetical protein M1475_01900 [Actinobacteria bacterium]|nr:hypothetical protein [Actinomycetota bacterium]
MKPAKKGSNIYKGMGRDGKYRVCKFGYHKDNEIIKTGTSKAIALQLGFKNIKEMKDFIKQDKKDKIKY